MLLLRSAQKADALPDGLLKDLVVRRFREVAEDSMEDDSFLRVVVIEPDDNSEALTAALGFSVMENRFDGSRFGDPAFHPSFELIEEHSCCYEMVFVLSDDGSGAIVFVPKTASVPKELLQLCEQYAIRSPEPSP